MENTFLAYDIKLQILNKNYIFNEYSKFTEFTEAFKIY